MTRITQSQRMMIVRLLQEGTSLLTAESLAEMREIQQQIWRETRLSPENATPRCNNDLIPKRQWKYSGKHPLDAWEAHP